MTISKVLTTKLEVLNYCLGIALLGIVVGSLAVLSGIYIMLFLAGALLIIVLTRRILDLMPILFLLSVLGTAILFRDLPFKGLAIWAAIIFCTFWLAIRCRSTPKLWSTVRPFFIWGLVFITVKVLILPSSLNWQVSLEQAIKFTLLIALMCFIVLTCRYHRSILVFNMIIQSIITSHVLILLLTILKINGLYSFGSIINKPYFNEMTIGSNTLAPILLMLVITTLYLVSKENSGFLSRLAKGLTLFSSLALIGLASRTALLAGVVISAGAIIPLLRNIVQGRWGWIILCLPAVSIFFVSSILIDAHMNIFRGREVLWSIGKGVLHSNWLFGIGEGTWYDYLSLYPLTERQLYNPFTGELIRGGLHNVFLQTAIEQGLVGIIFLFAFIILAHRSRNDLIIQLLVLFIVHGLTESNGLFFGQLDNPLVVLSYLYAGLGLAVGGKGVLGREGHYGHTSRTSA